MKNNKGLSYYEMLIVITIMSLMVGFATISIGTVYRNNVNRAADSLESSVKDARNKAMSKGSKYGVLNLYRKNNKLYVNVGEEILSYDSSTQDWRVLATGLDYIGVQYDTGLGDVIIPINEGTLATVAFKQSTGECLGIKFPYNDPVTRFPSAETTFHLERKNSDAYVYINKFGDIGVE